MEYMPRMADDMLKKKLSAKRAVLLEGAKWCGKTTTASQQAGSILYMQDPDRLTQNLELARLKPSRLLQGRSPCMIDEWQIAENLCIRDLRVYAEVIGGSIYHYRDKNGLECDAVVHLRQSLSLC